ncbi:MAG: tRNA (adenosine(37)-N6)-threonylcarbamoyltransferase complex dimerization subunit type 1 TsaB [Silicimonas sp.]|nr:tRNA (adenosine(37)-N6)-threonylcarbamoyltransferase complex dimerization subunit type 1 TsaB [Silicimonas sp.]
MKDPAFPRILAFDTSGEHCGVAVLLAGDIAAALHEPMGRGQTERLFPMIDEVLESAGIGFDGLDAIGVGVGPGNFTGIRISVSAARGLSLSLGIPAIGVSLFDALAEGAPDAPLLLSLRAARDRFYLQERKGEMESNISVAALGALPRVKPDTLCIGVSSAEIAANLGLKNAPAAFAPAPAIARAASRRQGMTVRPAPLYVRAADATPPSDPPPVILPDDT